MIRDGIGEVVLRICLKFLAEDGKTSRRKFQGPFSRFVPSAFLHWHKKQHSSCQTRRSALVPPSMRVKFLPNICRFHVSKEEEDEKKTKIRTALSSKCATFVPSHRVCSVTGLCEGRKWKTCRIQSPTERKKGKLEENLSISRSSSSPFNAIESKQIKLRRKKLKKPAPNESKKKSLAIAKQTIKRKWKRKHRSELELAAISFVRHRQSKTKSTLKLLFFRDARNRPLWAEYTRLDVGYMNG